MAAADYFSLPIFFIIFRETTEAAIIVSVLLSFLSQVLTTDFTIKKRLQRQVKQQANILASPSCRVLFLCLPLFLCLVRRPHRTPSSQILTRFALR